MNKLLFLAVAVATAVSTSAAVAQTSTAPLVQQTDLVYQGAFRVPQGTTDTNTANYGGTSIAYNPARNSLFIVGHEWHQRTAEISIPELVNSTSIGSLRTASVLQNFVDATEGKLGNINRSDPNSKRVGGQLVYNNKLYLTGYSFYDGAGTQTSSHFSRPLSLTTTGQVEGPVRVGNQYPGFVSGYMTEIPPEWRGPFGGPALTGNCCLAIAALQSNGPAASVFNPENMSSATPILGYPLGKQLGPGEATTNPLYNLATKIRGIVFPAGTRSILFFGRHGVGNYCYGTGAECGDPADSSKGVHAYPYRYQVWAYDANDLLAVKNGTKAAHQPQPYAVWTFNLPFFTAKRSFAS
jgi:hypothetical protein